ncbi:hypothetical protein EHQ52_10470 [Leptospira koniambonensis]|uniref:Rhomboid family intramembrane serine protease n=1 Tax=Leptospira koniambonensis TaxID=2484950 RepID=A0A4R9JAE3_9LEPT|nr:hypothetical protein [Leptospira koniambonensis]TGL34904.1 hypothetical protein EHQ52_10470 [Leptospira koniambonensis]
MRRLKNQFIDIISFQNAAGYFAAITFFVSLFSILIDPKIGVLTRSMLEGGRWWNAGLFVFHLLPPAEILKSSTWPWFFLAIYTYFVFVIGKTLEEEIGSLKFNLFLFSLILFNTIGGVLSLYYPLFVDTKTIGYCIFFALTFRTPNQELSIIPIRMKWVGIGLFLYLVLEKTDKVSKFNSILPWVGLLFGFSCLLLFFGKDILSSKIRERKTSTWKAKQSEIFTVHKCYVCGATEATDPQLEFRYCINCNDKEYCEKHLHDHSHS